MARLVPASDIRLVSHSTAATNWHIVANFLLKTPICAETPLICRQHPLLGYFCAENSRGSAISHPTFAERFLAFAIQTVEFFCFANG
jgi:hypothetical protein